MKIEIDFDDLDVNAKGEYLRGKVFKYHNKPLPEANGRWNGFGCYSTFEVNNEFEEIDIKEKHPELYLSQYYWMEEDEYPRVHSYESPEIIVSWYWDGDGYLMIFNKEDGKYYRNGDCKKSYNWEEA
jgi:hypothetical protein